MSIITNEMFTYNVMVDKYYLLAIFGNLLEQLKTLYCISYSYEITMFNFFDVSLLCQNYYKIRIIFCY